jgi:hypothetical protein
MQFDRADGDGENGSGAQRNRRALDRCRFDCQW